MLFPLFALTGLLQVREGRGAGRKFVGENSEDFLKWSVGWSKKKRKVENVIVPTLQNVPFYKIKILRPPRAKSDTI